MSKVTNKVEVVKTLIMSILGWVKFKYKCYKCKKKFHHAVDFIQKNQDNSIKDRNNKNKLIREKFRVMCYGCRKFSHR